MSDENQFARFLATASSSNYRPKSTAISRASGNASAGGSGGGGWMTTRKLGRDDVTIRKAASKAAEVRKSKNRRGENGVGAMGEAAGGKCGSGSRRRKKKDDFIDYSSEEDFDYSEDEMDVSDDSFIVHSEEEEGENGSSDGDDNELEKEEDWNSDLEDDDSMEKNAKKSKLRNKNKKKKTKPLSKPFSSRPAEPTRPSCRNRSMQQLSVWNPPSPPESIQLIDNMDDVFEDDDAVPRKITKGTRPPPVAKQAKQDSQAAYMSPTSSATETPPFITTSKKTTKYKYLLSSKPLNPYKKSRNL